LEEGITLLIASVRASSRGGPPQSRRSAYTAPSTVAAACAEATRLIMRDIMRFFSVRGRERAAAGRSTSRHATAPHVDRRCSRRERLVRDVYLDKVLHKYNGGRNRRRTRDDIASSPEPNRHNQNQNSVRIQNSVVQQRHRPSAAPPPQWLEPMHSRSRAARLPCKAAARGGGGGEETSGSSLECCRKSP
jgi:hypothetical protein